MSEDIKYIQELSLRLLGYYNEPDQKLNAETERPEFAEELGKQLDLTFSNIEDVNHDDGFADALKNGVFLMRDRNSHLYAYWPKEKVTRVTGVVFNRQFLTSLPLEYKYWFTPGGELTIGEKGTANTFAANVGSSFIEYLRNPENYQKKIILNADYLPDHNLEGELISVGKDFFIIRDLLKREYVVTKHMCIQLGGDDSPAKTKTLNLEVREDSLVPANGRILKYDPVKGWGRLENNNGDKFSIRSFELLDDSRAGDSVTFTPSSFLNKKKGTTVYVALAIHKPKKISEILNLAEENIGKKEIVRTLMSQILDIDPDNDSALEMLDNLKSATEKANTPTEETTKYKNAVKLMEDGKYLEAIELFQLLLQNGIHVKDSVTRIASSYYALYSQEEDQEDKDVYKNQLLEFIRKNHVLLSKNLSQNLRLQYYNKLGLDDEYIKTVDTIIQDVKTDNQRRSKMLFYKAMKYSQIGGRENEANDLIEESLFLNPFFNKAELISYVTGDDAQPSAPNGRSDLMSLLLQRPANRIDKDNAIFKVTHMDASDDKYPEALYDAAIAGRGVTAYSNQTTSYMAQYISLLASRLVNREDSLASALYTWEELFRLIPGFGYYVQWNLASMLHTLLHVPIYKDINKADSEPWENRKNWKEILDSVSNIYPMQWNYLLPAISTNKDIVEHIATYISSSPLSGSFASYAVSQGETKDAWSKKNIVEAINNIVRKQQQNSAVWKATNYATQLLGNKKKLAEKYSALSDFCSNQLPTIPLSIKDKEIAAILVNQCLPLLSSYLQAPNPDERKDAAAKLDDALQRLLNKVSGTPSYFGIELIWPVTTELRKGIGKLQHIMRYGDHSELELVVDSDNIGPDSDGKYTVKFTLSNAIDSLTATDIRIELQSKYVDKNQSYYMQMPVLAAGASNSFSFRVQLQKEIIERKSWTFAIRCLYKENGKEQLKWFTPLQVHLNQNVPFVPIETNPFTIAPALQENDPTYVVRENYMKQILNAVLHPQRAGSQIIVYGQKRCGKSTLVEAVHNKLNTEYADSAWCVYTTLRIESRDPQGKRITYSEREFYRFILHGIKQQLINEPQPKPDIKLPSVKEFEETDSPTQLFSDCIVDFKNSMKNTPGWEDRRLVLIIDEFTVLYNSIKAGTADEQILHHWKGIQESPLTNFATIFVGHDITPTFFNEPYARNATGIIDRMLVTYLTREEAFELIQRPIRVNGKSRFEDDALEWIYRYTAGNPYYLQMFMRRMVDYINAHKVVSVTETDVKNVVQEFITKKYDELSSITSFDSLINSGLEDRFCDIKDKQFEIVLRAIAKASNGIPWCTLDGVKRELRNNKVDNRSDLETIHKRLDFILQDLYDRKVIDRRDNNQQIRIIVGIFKEWLIRN